MSDETQDATFEPDPDNPGWLRWLARGPTRYVRTVLGPLLVRAEGETVARVRLFPREHLTNSLNIVHGGATLGLIDVSLFVAIKVLRGIEAGSSLTLGLDTQFLDAGDPDKPLDSVVEILRETNRLVFLRGLVVQDEKLIASFSATTRKPVRPSPERA